MKNILWMHTLTNIVNQKLEVIKKIRIILGAEYKKSDLNMDIDEQGWNLMENKQKVILNLFKTFGDQFNGILVIYNTFSGKMELKSGIETLCLTPYPVSKVYGYMCE